MRIVAEGFRQVHGVEIKESFAPVVSLDTIQTFLDFVARKLLKALHVLKQVPRQLYAKINSSNELKLQCCPYFKHIGETMILLVLYVEYLLLSSNVRVTLDNIKNDLMDRLKMKDFGPANEFLAKQISPDRTNRALSLSQDDYVHSIIDLFGCSDRNRLQYGNQHQFVT